MPPHRLAWLGAALAIAGCYPDRLGHIETVIDSGGRLHVLVHRITAEAHGGGHAAVGFRHADQTDAGWTSGALDRRASTSGYAYESTYHLHVASDDRLVAVINVADGFEVLARMPGDEWEPVALSERPAIAAPAGASWMGSDDRLRILTGDALVEVSEDGTSHVTPTGGQCDVQRQEWNECHFHPTGDQGGEAAVYGAGAGFGSLSLRRLDCETGTCAWSDAVEHGLGEFGGLINDWTDRMFLHTALGTPTVVHRSGLAIRVGAAGRSVLVGGETYRFGAAARPSGGIVVVASAYYTDALALHVIPDDLSAAPRTISLPTLALRGSIRLSLIVEGAPEHAHVVLATGPASLVHLDVDLESEELTREDITL